MSAVRTPAKHFTALAIGAPEPYRQLPVRLERMVHFVPPHNEKIRAKIRRNIILPQDIPGNPDAIFDVTLLPTGEVLTVRKRKSSGHPGYDDSVERAIMKSSPLPQPDDRSLFQRQLELKFRPQDR